MIQLKRQLPTWGAQRLKRDFDLPLSEKTIRRIWHQENLLKRKRQKSRTKQDLRTVKAQCRLFEQICADVETVHGLIEDEFYGVETFNSRTHFLQKAAAYNPWFNVARKNSSKHHKTPWEIVTERKTKIHPAVATWKPVYLDELWKSKLAAEQKRGYDVIPQPGEYSISPCLPMYQQGGYDVGSVSQKYTKKFLTIGREFTIFYFWIEIDELD